MPDDRDLVVGVIQYFREGDEVVAALKLRSRGGKDYSFTARVPISPIVRQLAAQVKKGAIDVKEFAPDLSKSDLEVGFGWGDVVSGIKKVAGGIALNRATKALKKIVDNPLIKKGMGLAGTLYPPLGATYGAVAAGSKLLDMVRGSQGPKKQKVAAQKIATITAGAKELEPAPVHAHALLEKLYKIKKHEVAPGVPAAPPAWPAQLRQVMAPPYLQAYAPRPVAAAYPPPAPQPYYPPAPQPYYPPAYRYPPPYYPEPYYPRARARARRPAVRRRPAGLWRRGLPGFAVAGWGANVPYRSVLQAAIQPDPSKWMRDRYWRGLRVRR